MEIVRRSSSEPGLLNQLQSDGKVGQAGFLNRLGSTAIGLSLVALSPLFLGFAFFGFIFLGMAFLGEDPWEKC